MQNAATVRLQASQENRQVIVFTSQSLVAHRYLNDVLPFLEQQGIKPVIFLTPDSKSPRGCIPPLQRFGHYDTVIPQDVIYPALEAKKCAGGRRPTPTFNELMQRHACLPRKVENLKDSAIMDAINSPNTIGALSIYHDAIFKDDLISAVKEKGFFWNLHPALLPHNKGLYVIFWLLNQGQLRHGSTLHEINEGIDTGNIIATHEGTLDPSKSVFESYLDFVSGGSALIQQALTTYLREGQIEAHPQEKTGAYYTFPTEADILAAEEKGIRLLGTPQEMLDIYARHFGTDPALSARILRAMAAYEGPNLGLSFAAQQRPLPALRAA